MPILGADMKTGRLIAWRKQPGDRLRRGDVIAEVETDKADVEVEVFADGVLEKLLVEPDTEVPVGTPLAIIRETSPKRRRVTGAPAAAIAPEAPRRPLPVRPVVTGRGAFSASPAARRLAERLGVDLSSVQATGPGGRVQERDVSAAAARPAAALTSPVSEAARRQARMREAIAAAMTRSHREIPQFHLGNSIDMSRALAWLASRNEGRSVADRLLYGVLLIKAVALALRDVPELNGVWENGTLARRSDIHVGVAISLRGGGLVAPALHDTANKELDTVMREFIDLVRRARAGSLRSSELSEPTITVTSLGEQGVESVFGLIYPPQVALVGFGRIVRRPRVEGEQIVPRSVIVSSLTADHRVVDGHRGSAYLAAVERLLQEPERL